jgi:chromatin segregation and condensation protein Rec8/ScpA/Scc1 (kleisin family)
VEKKAEEIIMRLRRAGRESVAQLLLSCHSRTEMVATFIVLLELCSSGSVSLEDEEEGVMVRPAALQSREVMEDA